MDHAAYEVVVGLEVHAQLSTRSKLFCGDSTQFGSAPNTQVSAISLAHPGTLPKLNREVIELAVRLGLALQCSIETENIFARKNYFYPDLPKGYQISQHTNPICTGGILQVPLENSVQPVLLNRIHIEEDAGKSIHDADPDFTCVDLNRAGVPLLEIVTEPCIHSSETAFSFLTELRRLLRWLDVCDGNMEEGSMRCDANISVRKKGDTKLGTRVEVKNLNSIRNVKKAIDLEADRLIALSEKGEPIRQETRSFDADQQITFSLRSKEEAEDYRYFPDPDLPPFLLTSDDINRIRQQLPALPEQAKEELQSHYQLSAYDAAQIVSDRDQWQYFQQLTARTSHYKAVANWMNGPLRQYCNEQHVTLNDIPVTPPTIARLIELTETNKLSFGNATGRLWQALLTKPDADPDVLAASLNLLQESDAGSLMQWVEEAIAAMPDKVTEYKKGKKGLIGLFAGEVKKRSKGKADMQQVNRLLEEKLNH
ncbi:MAG TPA: Asp-tRNA(Asn)/Glu-tRNA(Gln) amidotransferase subunit GatB [Ferruginibacter sp.]|nr:Asp-tRNA(Asn)/Glu-tRNA(Gln) amidotransferase subunit GatB [Ferruginibacter sp.]